MLASPLSIIGSRWLFLCFAFTVFCVPLSWLYLGGSTTFSTHLSFPGTHLDETQVEKICSQRPAGGLAGTGAPALGTSVPDNPIPAKGSVQAHSLLPSSYSTPRPPQEFCQKRFGVEYLFNLRDSATQYCTDGSSSPMTCFNTDIRVDKERDVFCVAKNAKYNAEAKKIELGCDLKEFNEEEKARGAPKLENFYNYNDWFQTGAAFIFNESIALRSPTSNTIQEHLVDGKRPKKNSRGTKAKYTILIKRELNNFGHNMNELISTVLSLDVLQITIDPTTNEPFFKAGDEEVTQILLLDSGEKRRFLELQQIFAKLPVRTKDELEENEDLGMIIVPLPGVSNPMWPGAYVYQNCHHPWEWLRAFSNRVLDHYNLLDHPREQKPRPKDNPTKPVILEDYNKKVVVTFVERTKNRVILNQKECIDALRKAYPDAEITVHDYSEYSFAEQLNITHGSDVLVGAHGAAMVHTIFLRQDTAVVEIQPKGVTWAGHRNEASGLGINYFMTHVNRVSLKEQQEKDESKLKKRATDGPGFPWQVDDLHVEPDLFVKIVGSAIHSVYGKRAEPRDV